MIQDPLPIHPMPAGMGCFILQYKIVLQEKYFFGNKRSVICHFLYKSRENHVLALLYLEVAMKKNLNAKILSVLLLAALALGGCGSAGGSAASNAYQTGETTTAAESYDGGYYEEKAEMEEAAAEEDLEEGEAQAYGEDKKAAESDEKLVYTCSIEMETLTYAETEAKIREAIKKYRGSISYESSSDGNYTWYYEDGGSGTKTLYLTIRIPTADYRSFLADLEGVGGNIRSSSMNVENITRTYNDQTVRIQSLEKQEERLLEMMDKAETIEEMVIVEDRLTEVQTELNQARTRLNVMDHDVAYSTINLNLREVVRYTPNANKQSFGERISEAFSDSFRDFTSFLQDMSVALIYLFPYLILIALVAGLILFATRKGRARRRERRAEQKAIKERYKEEMRAKKEEKKQEEKK